MALASWKRFWRSVAPPTATIFSLSVITEPFQITRLFWPRVTTIPFSNLMVILYPFALYVAVPLYGWNTSILKWGWIFVLNLRKVCMQELLHAPSLAEHPDEG